MSGPTTIDTVYDNPSNDAEKAVNQTVDDINQLYVIMYNIGLSEEDVDDCIDNLSSTSNAADYYKAGTGAVNLLMGETLVAKSNTVAGGLCFLSQLITVIADLTDLATIGQNSFMGMSEGNKTSDDGDDYATDLNESLNAFNKTTFTIHKADGTEETVNGLLNVLSNNSLEGEDEEVNLWGDKEGVNGEAMCPMDATSANTINTSVKGITNTFSDWDNPETYFDEIQTWAEGTTDEYGIVSTGSEISDISNDFGQIDSQLQTNSTKIGNDLSYGMQLYDQYLKAAESTLSPDLANYVVSQSGR
jgi:hypothetical protein